MRRFLIVLVVALAGTLFACDSRSTPVGPPPPPPSANVLSGVVRDANSLLPIAGANVAWAGLAEAWGDRGHGVGTDAEGRYRLTISGLEGLGPEINVQASKDGYVPQVVQVSVAGELEQDFRLVPAGNVSGGTLSGVVRDAASSQPIAGASVIWAGLAEVWGDRGHGVTTDANGRYLLPISDLGGPGSETGTINVQATKPGYVPKVVQVSVVGKATLDFEL